MLSDELSQWCGLPQQNTANHSQQSRPASPSSFFSHRLYHSVKIQYVCCSSVTNDDLLLACREQSTQVVRAPGRARVCFRSASGIYNSSEIPQNLPWNTYIFCNAPHINATHYELARKVTAAGVGLVQLLHVSVLMRHHKVHPRQPV